MTFASFPLEILWYFFAYLSLKDLTGLLSARVIRSEHIGRYFLFNRNALRRLAVHPTLKYLEMSTIRCLGDYSRTILNI